MTGETTGTDKGSYTVTVTGKGNYAGSATVTFAIGVAPAAKTSIAKAKVTFAKTAYVYEGKAKKPTVKSVVLNGKKLNAKTDYTVSYANNVKAGTAAVTVTGKGDYKDSAKAQSAEPQAKPQQAESGLRAAAV